MQVEVSDLKAKEAVQLSFRLPLSGVAVDVVGVVAWGDEKRHGIQFTYMGAQSRQSILQYITEQRERSIAPWRVSFELPVVPAGAFLPSRRTREALSNHQF
jgi:hypothetical protein